MSIFVFLIQLSLLFLTISAHVTVFSSFLTVDFDDALFSYAMSVITVFDGKSFLTSAISAAAAAAVGGRRKGEMASTNEAGVERPVQSVPEFGGCGISATNDPVTT